MKKLVFLMLFSLFLNSLTFAQSINCAPCQTISGGSPYSITNTDPFWVKFKKRINCIPSYICGYSNLQTTSMDLYDTNYSGYVGEPTFHALWDNLSQNTGIIPSNTINNFASKFRQAVEWRLNGGVFPTSTCSGTYRYVKCIEIQSITYVGLCCGPYDPKWHIVIRVSHGIRTQDPNGG